MYINQSLKESIQQSSQVMTEEEHCLWSKKFNNWCIHTYTNLAAFLPKIIYKLAALVFEFCNSIISQSEFLSSCYSMKHRSDGDCSYGSAPRAMGIPLDLKGNDELKIIYSYSVRFVVSHSFIRK